MVQRECGLDQPGDARGHVKMADIRLHRPQRAELPAIGSQSEGLGEARHFDGIAQRCGGAMRLDVADGVRLEPRKRRSEEHTSELQSQSNLVCRLLLEKKKKKKK